MHPTRTIGAALSVGALTLLPAAPGGAAATTSLADWGMNESAGAVVMHDGSGNGIDGSIGSIVETGTMVDDAIGYRWPYTKPNAPPAKPERIVTVSDSRVNPGTDDYAVTVRFRTTHSFGNIIQKGQAGSKGGYFKWQLPKGRLSCLFRGVDANGNKLSKAVSSGTTLLNDGNWHTVRCERTTDAATVTIDNEIVRRGRGPTGSIPNRVPLTIGGKLNCDQVDVTCDYFVGDIDYVRIEK